MSRGETFVAVYSRQKIVPQLRFVLLCNTLNHLLCQVFSDDHNNDNDVNDDDDDDDDDDDVNDDYLRLLTAHPPPPSALSRQLRHCSSDGKAFSLYCCSKF